MLGFYAITWPGFYGRHIAVTGVQLVSKEEILAKAAVPTQKNLWLQNMRAVALRLESIPYVKKVAIHRSLPANLWINVTERAPSAVVAGAAGTALIDADGRVLETTGPFPFDLPRLYIRSTEHFIAGHFIRDRRIARMQKDYDVLASDKLAVHAIHLDVHGELSAQLQNGILLKLGEDGDLSGKAALVQPILHQIEGKIERVTALDLRAPKTPVVLYK